MKWNTRLKEKVYESIASVIPITAIVLILSISIAPMTPGALVLFLFGALMLVFGMGFFTLGVDMSMIPMGEGIGVVMSKSKKMGGIFGSMSGSWHFNYGSRTRSAGTCKSGAGNS